MFTLQACANFLSVNEYLLEILKTKFYSFNFKSTLRVKFFKQHFKS